MISVVVPLYNKRPHIHFCVRSILEQTYTDYELIIVDDASTDGSLNELDEFSNNPKIRIANRRIPGPGGYAARNHGALAANGDWIAFLDADDTWSPGHLEGIATALTKHPNALVASSGWHIASDGSITVDPYTQANQKRGTHTFDLETYVSGPSPICTSVVAVKKELFQSVGGFDEDLRHGGDKALWLRLLMTGATGVWSNHIGATYNRNSVNMVTSRLHQEFSPSSRSIKVYLGKKPDIPKALASKLKKYANSHSKRPALRAAANGRLTLNHVARNFFCEKVSLTVLRVIALSALPAPIQRRVSKALLRRAD